jgi:hypothetical protein
MKIPNHLIATDFHKNPESTAATKKAFHAAGKVFLRSLAKEIGNAATAKVSSCLGGPAVLGEPTLHSEKLYIMLTKGFGEDDIQVLYRTCRGHQDSTGGANRYVSMSDLAASGKRLAQFIDECKRIEQGLLTA